MLPTAAGVVVTGFASGEAVIAGGPAFVPSRGDYRISKEYAFSSFLWDVMGFTGIGLYAYEHEFLVQNTGFARYANHWSSNLPGAYSDIEDNAHSTTNTEDEFVIGSDHAEGIVPGQWYWTFVDLSEQDRLVPTSNTILEAELLFDFFENVPLDHHPIAVFTAPVINGTWGIPAFPLAQSTATYRKPASTKPDANIDASIVERRELLRVLASESPAATVRATISLAHYGNLTVAQAFLDRHQMSAEAVWYTSSKHGFSGGFTVTSTLLASAEHVTRSLIDNMVFTRQEWEKSSAAERPALDRSLAKHQMMLETFQRDSVMIYGIDVVATAGKLNAMHNDPTVRLVDVRLNMSAPTAVQGRQRPLRPSATTKER